MHILTQLQVPWIFRIVEFETLNHHRSQTPWQSTDDPWMRNTVYICISKINKKKILEAALLVDQIFCYMSLTIVWKHEWSWTKNGGFCDSASTRFSTIVHSTSSSWMIMSFLRIFMANKSSVPFRSANITYSKNKILCIWIFHCEIMKCLEIYLAERSFAKHHQEIKIGRSN